MNSFFLEPVDTAGISITHPDSIPRPKMPPAGYAMTAPPTAQFSDFQIGWLPTFTDRPPTHVPARPARIGVTNIFEAALAPLGWEPHYPTYWPSPRLHRTFYRFGFDPLSGADMRVAQQLAWDPKQKAPLVRRPRLRSGGLFYSVPAAVIASEAGCVEMIDQSFSVPGLIEEVVDAPTFIDETFTVPAFLTEDLC